MLFGRVLSRDVARLQLQQLHKVLELTANVSKSRQLPFRVASVASTTLHRNYATATRPTRTVKAAVKRAARKPAPKTTRARKSTKAKKPATRKAAPKKKAKTVKKKLVKKKAAPKKKIPSERQKLIATRTQVKNLRATALDPPVLHTTSAWEVFVTEILRSNKSTQAPQLDGTIMKDASVKFKTLTPAEREHYNHLANESTAEISAAYHAWVKKHTALDIRRANIARTTLSRLRRTKPELSKLIRPKAVRIIQDERRVSMPRTPMTIFTAERHHTGDFKGIRIAQSAKLIGEEWKALTDGEKKKYFDMSSKDRERYQAEHLKVYGIPAGSKEIAATP